MAALAPPAAAQESGSVTDFRLPPTQGAEPAQPAQGPVVPDVPTSREVLQPAQPSPTRNPAPTPAPGTAPPIVLPPVASPSPAGSPNPAPSPAPRPPRIAPRADGAPAAPSGPNRAAPTPQPTASAGGPEADLPALPAADTAPDTAPPAASPATPTEAPEAARPSTLPTWLPLALLILALAAAGAWLWRRRAASPPAVPQIERPKATPTPAAAPTSPAAAPAAPATGAAPSSPQPTAPATGMAPSSALPLAPTTARTPDSPPRPTSAPATPPIATPGTGPESALDLALQPLRLSLTLMNASLAYRLELHHRGAEPIEQLRIHADMIGAHGALPREQQLSGPGAGAVQLASIARLEPGERQTIAGEVRLPLGQITPIRQGSAALLLPLARFRLEAPGLPPLTRTFLVALPPERPGAGLQPIRLDLGPRLYPQLATRAFA